MKKLIPLSLICLLLAGVSNLQAQTVEDPWGFTFRLGFAGYNGDLGNSVLEITENDFTYGIGLSYLFNDAWGVELNANMTKLEKANPTTDNVYNQKGTRFIADNLNMNLLLRWNFVNSFVNGRNSEFTPYITAGVAANFLHHQSSIVGGNIAVEPNDKSETFFSIPFGAGVSYAFTDDVSFNVQVLYNRTFTDNIDLFPISSSETKSGVSTSDLDDIDHDDYAMATVGLTFKFGGPEEKSVRKKKMLESMKNIEEDVNEINDEMDRLIELNEASLNALEELQEDLKMSDQQAKDLRAKFVRIVNNIQFAFDESYIIEPAKDELNSLVDVMKEYKNLNINLEAYADERGSAQYNDKLAQKRAQSVKDYLTSRGVPSSRVIINVYGEEEAVYDQASTDADAQTVWAQNRAVQITLDYNGS